MGFQDLEVKDHYWSEKDDILNSFYIPVLSKTKTYCRLAGFFSSTCLAVASRGVLDLIKNGGNMRLVVGAQLREADIEAITKGQEEPEKFIEEAFLEELDSFEDQSVEDHVRLLAWMVANKRLEIKVCILTDEDGVLLNEERVRGYYHMKVGIFEDEDGNQISFNGSVNESYTGWKENIEAFEVFRSWVGGENNRIKRHYRMFETYMLGLTTETRTIDIPEAVTKKLLSIAPNHYDELDLERYRKGEETQPSRKPRKLWDHQEEAIIKWKENGYRGIFAMATGTGKTFTALNAVRLASPFIVTVVLVPTRPLLKQWNEEIRDFDSEAEIVLCYGENPEWKKILPLKLARLRSTKDQQSTVDSFNRLYVVATMQTACADRFLINWKGLSEDYVQIIADEVHNIGATTYQRCMQIPSSRRLGLSATPERQWDDVGTRKTVEYFGSTVFEYDVKTAIAEGRLCHYKYYPTFAYLNGIEFKEFKDYTSEIDKLFAIIKGETNQSKIRKHQKRLERLLQNRAKIKKKARDKLRAFDEILIQNPPKPIIVFCEDSEQLEDVESRLKSRAEGYLIYTSNQNDWQRKEVLEGFKTGNSDTLLAIDCLNEGIDLPELPTCIIIASSTSTREFIQRRGRILRIGKPDKVATIHDVLVMPLVVEGDYDKEVAKKLFEQEYKRVKILIDAADNNWEVINNIRKELDNYGLGYLALSI